MKSKEEIIKVLENLKSSVRLEYNKDYIAGIEDALYWVVYGSVEEKTLPFGGEPE